MPKKDLAVRISAEDYKLAQKAARKERRTIKAVVGIALEKHYFDLCKEESKND